VQKIPNRLGYVKSGFMDYLDEGAPEIIYFKKILKMG
jgi:hypothetical protein